MLRCARHCLGRSPVPSTLIAEGIEVDGRQRPLLPATSLTLPVGSVAVVVGQPGDGHTALALALAGRLVPDRGKVTLDGRSHADTLQEAVALVDVPGVSEPDDIVSLSTIVGEELAMARRSATRRAVHSWLAGRDLDHLSRHRMEDVPGQHRVRILAELAAQRPGVRFLVITLPERHGELPDLHLDIASTIAGDGYGVLLTVGPAAAGLIHTPVFHLGPRPDSLVTP